jgi:NDP-sugar pyrophosphorylase family protein
MTTEKYIENILQIFPTISNITPWDFIGNLETEILNKIKTLDSNYKIENNIAIHQSATIESGVILKGCIIISEHCYVGSHAYLRGPIFLGGDVKIGPSVEIKQSVILDKTAVAHFNYIGNSIIGSNVNFEAGSICANNFNERQDKRIFINYNNRLIDTHTEKFGAIVGDYSKIGANAVLSPGTVLEKKSIVKRLELVEQHNLKVHLSFKN